MTVQEIIDEVKWLKADIKAGEEFLKTSKDKVAKGHCRARLLEERHQLMHWETTLHTIKCDPLF
jgi:hypothetical protein